jgi:hypothetical protein
VAMSSKDARKAAVNSALSVANDVAAGKLDPAELDAAATEACRELFGRVVGPGDPLWGLHLEVARGVLAAGGVPANELQEWLAVARASAVEHEPWPPPRTHG